MRKFNKKINITLYFLFSIFIYELNKYAMDFNENWLTILFVLAFINILVALFFFIRVDGIAKFTISLMFIASEFKLIEFLFLAAFMLVTHKNFAP